MITGTVASEEMRALMMFLEYFDDLRAELVFATIIHLLRTPSDINLNICKESRSQLEVAKISIEYQPVLAKITASVLHVVYYILYIV